jgi:hypothetical protein
MGAQVSQTGRPFTLFAQDPRFNSMDTDLLHTLNITATDSASEDGYITHTTFVFSPYLPWEVLIPTFLAQSDPILFIGNDIEDTIKLIELLGNDIDEKKRTSHVKIGESFLETRNGQRVGDLSHLHALAFEGLMIYWKRKMPEN